jgi:hypothetical protein
MRSIPAAMTWEILRRGCWLLLLAILTAMAFPAMLLTALRHDGLVDMHDKSMLIMQIVMLQFGMFIFGAMLYGAQGKVSQLYAYPVRTSELVAWRLLPVMALIALEVVVSVGVLNLIFGVQWPIWGPAIFAAAAIAAVMAVAWLTEKSVGWMIVGLTVVGSVLGLWFRSRYGPTFSDPTHVWEQLTPGEVFTMLAAAAASYWVAVLAVARNRCGDPPLSLGLLAWLEKRFDLSPTDNARLATPLQAQCWIEWRRKGWAMPFAAVVLLLCGLITWYFASRNAEDLYQGILLGGQAMWMLSFIGGILLGHVGPDEGNPIMGNFMATRPMSDADMGRAVLRTATKTLLLTWAIWGVACLIVCGCLLAVGARGAMKAPDGWNWWFVPATLLGCWGGIGVLMPLLLLGSSRFLITLGIALPAALIATSLISKFFLSREQQQQLEHALAAIVAVGVVIIGVWVYVAAHRSRLIQAPTVLAAATIWLTSTVVLAVQLPASAIPHWIGYLLIAAAAALVVMPMASVPLALSWNRHR